MKRILLALSLLVAPSASVAGFCEAYVNEQSQVQIWNNQNQFNGFALRRVAEAYRRACKKAQERGFDIEASGYGVIPKPEFRRLTMSDRVAVLPETGSGASDRNVCVIVSARSLDTGKPLRITRLWITKNGKSINIHESLGTIVRGCYRTASLGRTKLKTQTEGRQDSIIFYEIER